MKRKILSLALALMMILSVAVSIPVSAATDIVFDAANRQTTDASANGYTNSTTYYGGANGFKGSNSADVDWDTDGALYISSGKYITFKFNVTTAGSYDLYLAYGTTNASAAAKITVDGDASSESTHACPVSGGITTPTATKMKLITLTTGEHTIKISNAGGNFYLYNAKLEYIPNLEVETVKANTSADALSNNSTVSKGADTFAVEFSKNVVDTSVTDTTIALYDGDTKLDTYKDVVADTVYLTAKKALDAQKTYTIKVNGIADSNGTVVTGYALDVVTDAAGVAVSSYAAEATVKNVKVEGAADDNKRDVTVTGTILSSYGTPIEGRAVSLKLAGDTVWSGLSGANGVVSAKYEIPQAEADASQTYTFVLAGEGAVDKEVTLAYVSAAQEIVILGQLANANTATDVRAFIENPEYQVIFGLNPETDMPDYDGFDADLVYGQLTNLEVADVSNFKTTYKKAILLETINQAGSADAEAFVEAILTSSDDCELLGIEKAKLDCVEGAYADALVDAIAAINTNDAEKTFEEELADLATAVADAIDTALKTQYSKTDATSLATTTASVNAGQSFNLSLDVTPAQEDIEKIEYTLTASSEAILEEPIITTEYDYETEIVEGNLVVTITFPETEEEVAALSEDLEIGTITLSTPNTSGTHTVTLGGKVVFDVGIPYAIETDIAATTVTVTATTNNKKPTTTTTIVPTGNTSPKPTEDEDDKEEEKPDTQEPVVEEPVSNFNDLAGNEWAIEAINTLFDKGIISDNAEKTFRPNDNVTREEFVKMIVEALGLVHETYETDLNDVAPGAWYYPYVATAVEKGIVLGDENGNFRIGEKISRQDMAVIIIRVLTKLEHPYETKSTKFKDDKQISDYAKDAMYAAKNLGIINGVGDNNCAPKGTATRAMAAKVIYEMMRTVGL